MTAPNDSGKLADVLALVEKATPGEWEVIPDDCNDACTVGHCGGSRFGFRTPGIPGGNYRDSDFGACEDDAAFVAASVNYLRTHGRAIAELVEAGNRVTAAFRAIGNFPAPVAAPALRIEAEQAMLALDAGLRAMGETE